MQIPKRMGLLTPTLPAAVQRPALSDADVFPNGLECGAPISSVVETEGEVGDAGNSGPSATDFVDDFPYELFGMGAPVAAPVVAAKPPTDLPFGALRRRPTRGVAK